MKKKIFISAFHLIYLSILAKLLSFFVRILLARKLGSEAMTYYSMTVPTMVFLISVVQQGIPGALSKLTAQSKYPKMPLIPSISITAITTFFTILLYILLLPYLAKDLLHDVQLIPVLKAILPLLPTVACSGLLKGYLQGIQHHYQANITQFYEEAARIFFLVVCFQFIPMHDPITLAALAMFSVTVGELASCLYMLIHLRFRLQHICILPKTFRSFPHTQIKEILSISMPMMGKQDHRIIDLFFRTYLHALAARSRFKSKSHSRLWLVKWIYTAFVDNAQFSEHYIKQLSIAVFLLCNRTPSDETS